MAKSYRIPKLRLTTRESQILLLICDGKTHAEIAETLGVCTRTVINHASNLKYRLDAKSMPQAVATAFRLGLLT